MRLFIIASAVIAATLGLSGCAVYTVASTAVDITATVVSTTADVAGAIITAPFPSGDSDDKSKGK
jgi:hypothetical protein